jgi:gamma-glutamylcyclotransferase (GGCT)/AIG2-like uncharacterized protein YtfP
MEKLFVYGTLMRGGEREGLVVHLQAEAATVRGYLWKAAAGYPALFLNPQGPKIAGEVLEIPNPALFHILDLYEGISDDLYDRTLIEVETGDGTCEAWVYVMNSLQLRRSKCTPIKSTDWRTLSRRRGK